MKYYRLTLVAAFIGLISMFFMAPVVSAAGEIRLYLLPASISQTTGGQFDVIVRLKKVSADRVDYASVGVVYPASKLEVVSVSSAQTAFNHSSTWRSNTNTAGTVRVSGESNPLGNSADVIVVTIKFRSKAAGRADIGFTNDSAVGDLYGPGKVKNYLSATSGSVITVNDPPAPSSTTPSPAPQQSAPTNAPSETPAPDTTVSDDQSVTGDDDNLPVGASNFVDSEKSSEENSLGFMARYGWIGAALAVVLALASLTIMKLLKTRKRAASPAPFGPSGIIESETEQPLGIDDEVDEKEWPLLNSEPPAQEEVVQQSQVEQEEVAQVLKLSPVPDQIASLEEISEPVESVLTVPENQVVTSQSSEPEVQPPQEAQVVPLNQIAPAQAPAVEIAAPSPVPQVAPVSTDVAPTDEIPDMFEVGEERLRQQGYVSNVPPRPKS